MARNIVPRTDKGADLGTPAKNWNTVYTDKVVANVVDSGNLGAVEQSAGDEVTLRSLIVDAGSDLTSITIYNNIPITTTNLTIPSNVYLHFKDNGKLSPANGITLTIDCGIDTSSAQHIFGGEGDIVGNPKTDVIYPEWFGAIGDGVTDDTIALQKSADFTKQITIGTPFLKGNNATYRVTSTVTFQCNGDFSASRMEGDSSFTPTIRIGTVATNVRIRNIHFIAPVVANTSKTTGGGWGPGQVLTPNAVGIEAANIVESKITIPEIKGFAIGLDISSYTKPNAYNYYYLENIIQNHIGLRIQPKDASGWTNENIFYGGRFAIWSDESAYSSEAIHIQIDKHPSGTNQPDNNLFIKPSLESTIIKYHFEILNGRNNTFLQARYEGVKKIYNASNSTMLIGGAYLKDISNDFATKETAIHPLGAKINTYDGIHLVNNLSPGHILGYDEDYLTGNSILDETRDSTNWVYRLNKNGLQMKTPSCAAYQPQIEFDAENARINFRNTTLRYLQGIDVGIQFYGGIYPSTDGDYSVGNAALRWSAIYAVTGTIQTSDERNKQDIRSLNEAEKNVALKLKNSIKIFRFKDSVKEKGDNARLHAGIIAQEVVRIFEEEGLDAHKYGLLCYDEWEEDAKSNIQKSDSYGIRYNELLAFIIAAL